MPIYEYEVINDDGTAGERIEIVQKMSDEPLTNHPETGAPIRRVFSAPILPGRHSDHKLNQTLRDNDKLGKMGFTKYVKTSDGTYEKQTGTGPDLSQPK